MEQTKGGNQCHAKSPVAAVILKTNRSFRAEFLRGLVCDVTVSLYRLAETLDRLVAASVVPSPVQRRPEPICAHDRRRKFSRVYPGRLQDDVVTYQVVPIDEKTPPQRELAIDFAVELAETLALVGEAYDIQPTEPRGP